MNIAVDCRMINSSGIGTFLTGILAELLPNKNYNFVLIGNVTLIKDALGEQLIYDKVEFCEFNSNIFSISELFSYPTEIVNQQDCFFSPNFNIPLGITVPIISTIHDALFLDYPKIAGFFGTAIRKMWMNWAIRKSIKILTVSNFSKERLLYHFKIYDKIVVCGNGIKNIVLNNENIALQCNKHKYFLYVGNVKPHKGIDTLIEAYKNYRRNGGQLRLRIVGKYDNFKTKFEMSNISDDIEFTGYIDDNDLIDNIQKASCLIQPSLYEGFGIPPLEALCLGTPVILSDIPVFKEIYSDFPVKFFKAGDIDDLTQAMFQDYKRVHLTAVQRDRYSYKNVANVISQIFKEV